MGEIDADSDIKLNSCSYLDKGSHVFSSRRKKCRRFALSSFNNTSLSVCMDNPACITNLSIVARLTGLVARFVTSRDSELLVEA